MRKIYFLAALATMLAACSSNDKLDTGQDPQQPVASAEVPVGFDAYTQRGITRAGQAEVMTLDKLRKAKADGGGFGVFGFYTDNNEYDPQSQPNFMYNQGVFDANAGVGTADWAYDPVKYWPNEYGTTAISDDADKVSFFAYAPYVEVIPSTGKIAGTADDAKWGIAGMSRNSASGDPLIKYIASFDQSKSVDLLWGVCDDTNWSTVAPGSNDDYMQQLEAGKPWLNVLRPQLHTGTATDQRLKFQFKHALSQLSVNVNTFADNNAANDVNAKTRIYIRSIKFNGFAMKGALNLNNTEKNKALWLDFNGTADLENGEAVTVFDGRKDGKEGATGSDATNEKVLGLNPQFVQDENQVIIDGGVSRWLAVGDPTYATDNHAGVTSTLTSLFRKWDGAKYVASTEPVMVIPTGDAMEVEIVYDVETIDANLANYVSDAKTNGSSIENRISKKVTFGGDGKLENGKHYTLNLHLGMNSVKFDADVSDWQEGSAELPIDLPSNMPQFAAASPGAAATVNLPATTTLFEFAITGLNGGESVTAPADNGNFTGATSVAANSAGIAFESITIVANDKVTDQAAVDMTWTGNASGKEAILSFVQKAHALELDVNGVPTDGDADIVLKSGANGIDWTNDIDPTAGDIVVKKNGTALDYAAAAAAGKFTWTAADHKITLFTGEEVKSGDIFEITVKAGDAPAETITVAI